MNSITITGFCLSFFQEVCKRRCAVTFSELRMERAKEMLDSGKSVTETAEQLDIPHCIRFQEHTKITLKYARQKQRDNIIFPPLYILYRGGIFTPVFSAALHILF